MLLMMRVPWIEGRDQARHTGRKGHLQAPALDGKVPGGRGEPDARRGDADLSDTVFVAAQVADMIVVHQVPHVDG